MRLTHLGQMEFPTFINLTGPFLFKRLLGGISHFYSNFNRIFCKDIVMTPIRHHILQSDLGLHCLGMSYKKDARLKWV